MAAPSLAQALAARYPVLAGQLGGVKFLASPPDKTRALEFYPPGEGTNPYPGHPTVQTFGRSEQRDLPGIAGDLVSHYLARGVDPGLTRLYHQFVGSLTPAQIGTPADSADAITLHGQYKYAQQNSGESRPFGAWARVSGIPAYFRGYTFGQWPADMTSRIYTVAQLQTLNNVLRYLAGPKAYGAAK